MAQRVMAYDDVTERYVRTDKDPNTIGSIGDGRADCVSIPSDALSITVVFSSTLTDTNYTVNANFLNETDQDPLFQPITITNKTTGGFTAKWNIPIDTSNYELCYSASPSGFSQVSSVESLAFDIDSKVVTLSPPFGNTNYVVTANFSNTIDADPLYQPLTITNKSTSGFTAKWNMKTDTSNYALEWHISVITS